MSLINLSLLFGLGFAAIPIVLHLLMRAKPKRLVFPALRLIMTRKKTNTRRLRLRHIWLLLLRTLLFAVLVLAVARPRLPAANYGLTTRETITLLAIVLLAAAAYWWVHRRWTRQSLAPYQLRYRRSMLRGGTGGAIVLLSLLLVFWPYGRRISAEISGESTTDVGQSLPVAAVFLFDTSLSMEYRLENKTRLELAQEIAATHLSKLPPGSRVAIADSSSDRDVVFQADLISARARIDAMETSAVTLDLNDRIRTAIQMQSDDRERQKQELGLKDDEAGAFVREVYVFTDLARSAWRTSDTVLRKQLDEAPWLHSYVIDLSVEQPKNVGIAHLKLGQQSHTPGGVVNIESTVVSQGIDGMRTVELYLRDEAGNLSRHGQSAVNLESGSGARVSFRTVAPAGAMLQGELRLKSSDPLLVDDARYFTVGLNQLPRVLLVGESAQEAFYLQAGLDIEGPAMRAADRAVTYRSVHSFRADKLDDYDVVCLINVRSPEPQHWAGLFEFAKRGGGVAVFLGNSSLKAAGYNSLEAQKVLPAELLGAVKFFKGPFIVDLGPSEQHPIFRRIADSSQDRTEFSSVLYERAWSVKPVADARVLASYNNEKQTPAWLERKIGTGRTVMFTNAVDNIGDKGRAWSDLVTSWSFLRLSRQLIRYLSHHTDSSFNWISGQNVIVRFDRDRVEEKYLLRKPSLQQLPGEIPGDRDYVMLRDADHVGHYEFISGRGEDGFRSGFSVNSDDRESRFETISDVQLTDLFGENRFSRARHIEELDRAVQSSRIGREIYPLLMILVLLFFVGEHFVANRFYDADVNEAAVPSSKDAVAA